MTELNNNIPKLSVEKTIDTLSAAYCALLCGGGSPKQFPSVMLWGPPGVGKSQAIRQIARDIQAKTGRETRVTDVRLLLFNPIDLRGIPTANADKTLAIWLKPQIFQMEEREDLVNILFLDEISAAPQSVQAAAYQITLDRVVGEHRLPDNCIVIAAGNRVTDKSVSFKMPKALANRLLHLEVEGSPDSWKNWATRSGVHPLVVGYLSTHRDRLFGFDAQSDDLAFATPRSWEMVSNILNRVEADPDKAFPMIAGLVGLPVAYEFRAWSRSHGDIPALEEIFGGRTKRVPKQSDAVYALVSAMTAYAAEHADRLDEIDNSLRYARLLPADFTTLLVDNYKAIGSDFAEQMYKLPGYLTLASAKGWVLNGGIDR